MFLKNKIPSIENVTFHAFFLLFRKVCAKLQQTNSTRVIIFFPSVSKGKGNNITTMGFDTASVSLVNESQPFWLKHSAISERRNEAVRSAPGRRGRERIFVGSIPRAQPLDPRGFPEADFSPPAVGGNENFVRSPVADAIPPAEITRLSEPLINSRESNHPPSCSGLPRFPADVPSCGRWPQLTKPFRRRLGLIEKVAGPQPARRINARSRLIPPPPSVRSFFTGRIFIRRPFPWLRSSRRRELEILSGWSATFSFISLSRDDLVVRKWTVNGFIVFSFLHFFSFIARGNLFARDCFWDMSISFRLWTLEKI